MPTPITATQGLRTDPSVPSRQEIQLHLDEILASPSFKSSPKGIEFLRFVVVRCLDGEPDSLHERAIAVDLLRKGPNYEPSEDASVRVRANEVRKRLAGFYETTGSSANVRIELPTGGYVPQFRRTPVTAEISLPENTPLPPAVKSRKLSFWAMSGIGVVLLSWAGFAGFSVEHAANSPLEIFWRSVYAQPNPVVICIPGLRALYPPGGSEIADSLYGAPPSPTAVENMVVHGGAADLYVQDDIVGIGEALGAIRIAGYLSQKAKPVLSRISQDVTFADLRSHPVVLLGGARSSKWTEEMNQDVPFVFVGNGKDCKIVENRPPRRSWSMALRGHSRRTDVDYAIVGRIIDSKSGQIILIAAGLTTFGNESAAECLVENDCIAKITAQAPHDWGSKNIEAVIRTNVMGNTAGPPQVVTAQFW